jgi:hypothetical protein
VSLLQFYLSGWGTPPIITMTCAWMGSWNLDSHTAQVGLLGAPSPAGTTEHIQSVGAIVESMALENQLRWLQDCETLEAYQLVVRKQELPSGLQPRWYQWAQQGWGRRANPPAAAPRALQKRGYGLSSMQCTAQHKRQAATGPDLASRGSYFGLCAWQFLQTT